jgi:uncharacterized protein YdhG (YjbR/CyaY superfamily)
MKQNTELTVDDYIRQFDAELQTKLGKIRELIHGLAPGAVESLSYQIPTFKLNGKALVHFAAFKNHIGFYPTPSGIISFRDKLGGFKTSKWAIQFPVKGDLPLEIIKEIVQFRVNEVRNKFS